MSKPEPAQTVPPAVEAQGHLASAQRHFHTAMKKLRDEKPVTGVINTHLLMATYEQNNAILILLTGGKTP